MGETNAVIFKYGVRKLQQASQAGRSALEGLTELKGPNVPNIWFRGNDDHWRAIGSPNNPVKTMNHIGPQHEALPQITQPEQGAK